MQSSLCYRVLINSHYCSTLYCFQTVISKVACAFLQSQGKRLLPPLQGLSAHHPTPINHCPHLCLRAGLAQHSIAQGSGFKDTSINPSIPQFWTIYFIL